MNVPQELSLADYRALAEFRYQIRRFLRFSEDAARSAGIEPQHHQLMLAVKGMPAGKRARVADLAERLQLHHNSIVELVGRLAEKGLVERHRDGKDRREVYVRLTQRGQRILKDLTIYHRDELRSTVPALAGAVGKLIARRPRSNQARLSRVRKKE
ncbi:MAG: MarR family transcriptional regulator [Candidatus Korobacteraceae bacterium]|jgi:DNA-binding MarR family transcriptional regulator